MLSVEAKLYLAFVRASNDRPTDTAPASPAPVYSEAMALGVLRKTYCLPSRPNFRRVHESVAHSHAEILVEAIA